MGSSWGSSTTAKIRELRHLGLVILGGLKWVWRGKVENEDEKQISGVGWVECGRRRGLYGE